MVDQNNNAAKMDQFMNDFLDGKYLDEKPKQRHSDAPRRKSSKTGEDGPKLPSVRRTKTNEDVPSSRFRMERGVGRSKSGSLRSGRRSQRSSAAADGEEKPLDPQMVLRMMEMYADLDDEEKADSYLHYGMKKKDSPRSSATGKTGMPPDVILVRADAGTGAA